MAPIRWRRPEGRAAGRYEAVIYIPVHADAGAGVSIWAATYEGAPQPAATVTLHVAGCMKGACPSFPHAALQDEPKEGQGGRESLEKSRLFQ